MSPAVPAGGRRAHLKSLSLDVIFSSRLEMWKAAVLMVAARREPAGGREYGGAGPLPLPRPHPLPAARAALTRQK